MKEIEILWENEDLAVINKPAGVVTNRLIEGDESIEEWWGSRGGIVHRLDKETTGCLVLAKNQAAVVEMKRLFKARGVHKEYLALVHGRLEPEKGEIRVPIGRLQGDRKKQAVRYDGRIAVTGWQVERYYDDFTFVRLFPRTGRMHQIRVHLAHLKCPVVGDKKYLSREDSKLIDHHFLHSEKVRFMYLGLEVRVTAPLDIEEGLALKMLE